MATLKNIDNPVWGLSLVGYGVILEGIAAIRQRIDIAIRTTRGTDPMRPEFGSLVFKYIDKPVNVSVPNIKAEIIRALQLWVPEVQPIAIKHDYKDSSNPEFEITYRLTDDDLIDKLLFDLKNGTTTTTDAINELILQAFFPPNPNNYRYTLKVFRNGNQVFPAPTPTGFETIQELFNWAKNNLSYIGKWFLLTDKIVCYMNSDGVTSATISVETLPIVKISALFPELQPGQTYNVDFKINGVSVAPHMPTGFDNPGDVLGFAQANWTNVSWYIEFTQGTESIFSDEFSDEMEVVNVTGYTLIGISNDQNFNAVLSIS